MQYLHQENTPFSAIFNNRLLRKVTLKSLQIMYGSYLFKVRYVCLPSFLKSERKRAADEERGKYPPKAASCTIEKYWQLLRCPSDGQGLTSKDRSEGSQHGMTLLAHRGEITANATKSRCPVLTTKRSGDLLLDFDHPQIPFGLVIRKGDRQIVQEGEHLFGSSQQVIQQILGGTLLAPPALLGYVFG